VTNPNNQNMRLFLQSQSGSQEVQRGVRARVDIPGEYTGNAVILGQHQVARGGSLIVKPVSHQRRTYYDPSLHGTWHPKGNEPAVVETSQAVEVVEEDLNLQGFMARTSVAKTNVFADIGIIEVDDDVIAEDEAPDDNETSNAEFNAPNQSSPEDLFAELLERGPKSFGISKDELAAFKLTRKQVKSLYTDVTGRQPGNVTIPKMKSRIRGVAGESYADYTRVMDAIKKVME
jgi:hypothetical protein